MSDAPAAEKFKLKCGTFDSGGTRLAAGHISVVLGPVGSGKSAFIQALIGEMKADEEEQEVDGNFTLDAVENERDRKQMLNEKIKKCRVPSMYGKRV